MTTNSPSGKDGGKSNGGKTINSAAKGTGKNSTRRSDSKGGRAEECSNEQRPLTNMATTTSTGMGDGTHPAETAPVERTNYLAWLMAVVFLALMVIWYVALTQDTFRNDRIMDPSETQAAPIVQ